MPRSARNVTGAAAGVFAVTAAAARRGTVGATERAIFDCANRMPDQANVPLLGVMQFGSFGAIWVTAAVAASPISS